MEDPLEVERIQRDYGRLRSDRPPSFTAAISVGADGDVDLAMPIRIVNSFYPTAVGSVRRGVYAWRAEGRPMGQTPNKPYRVGPKTWAYLDAWVNRVDELGIPDDTSLHDLPIQRAED